MEAALTGMHAEDARQRRPAVGELPECVLDRGDAGIRREEPLYVMP